MTREEVFELINEERAYQDTDPHNAGHDDAVQPVEAWIIFIEQQIQEAKRSIYDLHKTKALSHVRKIAALAVACMEYNDTPRRYLKENE